MKDFRIYISVMLVCGMFVLPSWGNVNLACKDYDVAAQAGGKTTTKLNDGDVSGESEVGVKGLPAIFHLKFPQQTRVDAVRIYPGNVNYADNPSGECSLRDYTVEGLSSASGMWRELVKVKNAPSSKQMKVDSNEKYFFEHKFDPLDITEFRIVVTDSTDTQLRSGGVKDTAKSVIIRDIEVYNTKAVNLPKNFLGKMVQGDYRLAVYRNSDTAELYMICSDDIKRPLSVQISFAERNTKRVPAQPFVTQLKAGQNIIPIDIRTWPNGEYRTSIKTVEKDSPVVGEFGRLLRIDNLPAPTPPSGITAMSGQKMYFPDGWYLENQKGVEFKSFGAKIYQATSATPKKFINIGTGIYFAEGNKIVIPFYSKVRDWTAPATEGHYATANLDDLEKWTITDESNAARQPSAPVYKMLVPFPQAQPEWEPAAGQSVKYRFYNNLVDGRVPLNQVFMLYSHKPRNMGVIYAQPQTTWLAWKKSENEIVLLDRKPFLQDNISGEEFESSTDSNDNLAGQWLSKDGKTLYYVRGRLLRRFPPFIARYDNLWQVARLLTVFSTKDGFNWKRHYFGLPTEADPAGSQHYGADILQVPQGNGLMVSFTLNYNVMAQQFCAEVYYSWDEGNVWQRFPGQEILVPNGPQGTWTAGCINIYNDAIEKNGKIYHLIGWSTAGPHFSGDVIYFQERMANLDGPYLEKMFGKRDLKNWPYFKEYGSWQKLADAMKKYYIATGVAVYRKDGLFGLTAKDGEFTTRTVTASGNMSVNAKIDKGGEIRITLIDANGREIDGYTSTLTGDDVNIPVKFTNGKNLPGVPFKVKAIIKNATIYTLNF